MPLTQDLPVVVDAVLFRLSVLHSQLRTVVETITTLFSEHPERFSAQERSELEALRSEVPSQGEFLYSQAHALLAALGFGIVHPEDYDGPPPGEEHDEEVTIPFVCTFALFDASQERWVFTYQPHRAELFARLAPCFTTGYLLFVLEPYARRRMVLWQFQDGTMQVIEGTLDDSAGGEDEAVGSLLRS